MNLENKCIIVASHRRSGTHWLIDTLRNNFHDFAPGYFNLDRLAPHSSANDFVDLTSFQEILAGHDKMLILKTHTSQDLASFRGNDDVNRFIRKLIRRNNVIYIWRNGLDVMNSLHHYLKKFQDDVPESYTGLMKMKEDLGESARLPADMSRLDYWMAHVRGWHEGAARTIITYEELYFDYEAAVNRLAAELDLVRKQNISRIPLPPANRLVNKAQRVINRVLGFRQISSAVVPRKGTAGSFAEEMTSDDIAFFKQKAGPMMQEFGHPFQKQLLAL